MDPVSHVIFGRLLISLDRRRQLGRHAVAACLLGAIAPDVDAALAFFGWDIYLRFHQLCTHSLLGSVAVAFAAAGLVNVVGRGGRYLSLALAACVGALSHVVFDLICGGSIALVWPLSSTRISLPLVAMADPWLIAICAAGILALWIRRREMATTAAWAIGVLAAFLVVKAVLMTFAVSHWTAARGPDAIVASAIEAEWGSLTRWNIFDRTPDALRKWSVDALRVPPVLFFSEAAGREPAIVSASRSLDTVRNFLHAHELGFARVIPMDNGHTQVLWSDIRYCWRETSTDDPGLRCALWFGGEFDRNALPVMQIVHVGGWQQLRPAGR